jgi:hypothetical protein
MNADCDVTIHRVRSRQRVLKRTGRSKLYKTSNPFVDGNDFAASQEITSLKNVGEYQKAGIMSGGTVSSV